MEVVEDSLSNIKTEWGCLKEKFFSGEPVDPVFEGIVRDFCEFDQTLQDVFSKVKKFMRGIDSLCEGLVVLAETTVNGLMTVDDQQIKSDCYKMKEATNQISRTDAPYSAVAKLRRDMDFNIMNPIRNHIVNNRSLKANLEKRRRKLLELNIAKKAYDDMVSKGRDRTSRGFLSAQSNLEAAKMSFHEVDKHIFEWLYILEEYRGDIMDSCLQTLKYLQYEFFATAAHAISGTLPSRMEFRPMVEMTPEHLESQVDMELQEAEENDEDEKVVTDFSVRLIEKLAKDNKNKPGESVDSQSGASAVAVDPLSLSSLLSQGFEEGPARQALRKHNNNTQAALDYLVGGGEEEQAAEEAVRMPTTLVRVQRLRAKRRAQLEKRRQESRGQEAAPEDGQERGERGRAADAPPPPPAERPASEDPAVPKKPPAVVDLMGLDAPAPQGPAAAAAPEDLLGFAGEEPPPPTDFSKEVETLPLPPMQALDLTRCEKQPLAASVAAGTAQMRPQLAPLSPNAYVGPAGASGAGLSSLAAAQSLVAQANITPEQLLLAAQQLAAQQRQQQQPPPAAGGGQGAPSAGLASLDPFAG